MLDGRQNVGFDYRGTLGEVPGDTVRANHQPRRHVERENLLHTPVMSSD